MKTLREILLERHTAAEPALDDVRRKSLASLSSPYPISQNWAVSVMVAVWNELILPCRRVWSGLAAVWLVIVGLHLATGSKPKMTVAESEPLDRATIMVLREQRQIMAQMLETAPPAAAARPPAPGPRGDVRRPVAMA